MEQLKMYNHPTEINDKINELVDKVNGLISAKSIPLISKEDFENLTISSTITKYGHLFGYEDRLIDIAQVSGTECIGIYISPYVGSFSQSVKIFKSTLTNSIFTAVSNLAVPWHRTKISYHSVSSKNASINGLILADISFGTLEIDGSFSVTANIPAGTKLFNVNETIVNRMTHNSAINYGNVGQESFVGISIQPNGDVYCLGSLTTGNSYSIVVTASAGSEI